MRYEDFTIRIASGSGGHYGVFVSSPSMGSTESTLTLPYAPDELPALLAGIALDVRRAATETASRDVVKKGRTAAPFARDASEVGVQLYDALFHGRLKAMLDGSLARLLGEPEKGLRIRLEMNLRGEGMREVASLPWELMRPLPTEVPLAVGSQTVMVRVLDVERPTDPPTFTPPLKVLVIISNPTGTEPLDLKKEETRIGKSWGQLTEVEVHWVKPQVEAINAACDKHNFHVIHYMGHGGFDEATGHGILYLENPDRTPDPLDSVRLKAVFKEESNNLRLVFLNACRTAVSTERRELDPFAGIAATIIELGVPAVVAMQFPITDDAAADFADTFYRRIVDGDSVEAAVARSRLRLYTAGKTRAEWATPVLFMRSRHGLLFGEAEEPPEAAPARRLLLAVPTLVLLALLVGANYFRVATNVTVNIVAGKVAFDLQDKNPRLLLDRGLPFSELQAEHCKSMGFRAASLKARAPVEREFRWTSAPHPVTFECYPRSTINLRSNPEHRPSLGTLPQVRVDPEANVVLSVSGGRKPVLVVDVSTGGQRLAVPVKGEFEIETSQTGLLGPEVTADFAATLRSSVSTYLARLPEGREIDLLTADRTTLVVTFTEQTPFAPVPLTEEGSAGLPGRTLLVSGGESLNDLPKPLIEGSLSYPDFSSAPSQPLAGKHLLLTPGTEADIRGLAIGERGLTLTIRSRVVDETDLQVMEGAIRRDTRLTLLQRLYFGPGLVVAAAAATVLWLTSTLALWWWAVARRVRRNN